MILNQLIYFFIRVACSHVCLSLIFALIFIWVVVLRFAFGYL